MASGRPTAAGIASALATGIAALLLLDSMSGRETAGIRLAEAVLSAASLALAGALLRAGFSRADGERPLDVALSILIVLCPMWGLHSIPFVLRAHLGLRHPLALAGMAAVFGLPALAAWRLARPAAPPAAPMLRNLILSAAVVAFTFGAAETAVRVAGLDPLGRTSTRKPIGDRVFIRQEKPPPAVLMRPGAAFGHRYPSNERGYFDSENSIHYRTNGAGFRGDEFTVAKPAGTLRIAILGDSFGFGEGVKEEDIAASRLGPLLEKIAGCRVQVYNFSVPSYDTADEAALLGTTVLGYAPDLIVVWYFLNDVEGNETMQYLGAGSETFFFPVASRISALARLAAGRLDAAVREDRMIRKFHESYRDSAPGWKEVTSSLRRISSLAAGRGIPVVLFVHPVLYHLDSGYPFLDLHRRVVEAARREGMSAFDLVEAFPGHSGPDLWVHPIDQHPNEVAQRLAAGAAARDIAGVLPACTP